MAIIRKSARELELMAAAGEVVARTHELMREHVRPGVTTGELDRIGEEFIRSEGGVPTFKGYRGYPAALCISRNDMVVHGIPGRDALAEGDVVSIDVGVTLGGFVADSAWSYAVGEISDEAQRLLEACEASLMAGLDQARVGNRIGDISHAVQTVVEEAGFAVVRSLVGHGVGRDMHAEGMTLAIEPMITAGHPDVVLLEDRWSIVTEDGSLSAHFEHTVAVTEHGPRILTMAPARLLQ
jgi:methionyl aminopeptidase